MHIGPDRVRNDNNLRLRVGLDAREKSDAALLRAPLSSKAAPERNPRQRVALHPS